jgi:two-component system sensor histidine kinase AlgZ
MREPLSKKPLNCRRFLRVCLINLGAAFIAVLALIGVEYPVSPGFVVRTALISLVYAFTIGTIAGTLLPFIAVWAERFSWGRKTAIIAASIVVLTVVGCALASVIQIQTGLRSADDVWRTFWGVVRFCIVISLLAGLGMYFFESLRYRLAETRLELRTRQLEQERAEKLAAEARLSSLESHIHPHFLFNTLNSISALIHDEPRRAEEIVGRLAALLRFSLDANQCSLVPLEQEFKIVRDYLEIERARFGQRLRYSIDVTPEAMQASVPPLAVESLVENSVKHSIAPRREGGEVRVSARAAGGSIEIEVTDTGSGFSLEAIPRGHGIDNLLARLEVLYNGQARLDVGAADGRASVRLVLPERA